MARFSTDFLGYPSSSQYPMNQLDNNTGYNGYQLDSTQGGDSSYNVQPTGRYRPAPTALSRPPPPEQTYVINDRVSSFRTRITGQRNDYSTIPETDTYQKPTPFQSRPYNDDHAKPTRFESGDFPADHARPVPFTSIDPDRPRVGPLRIVKPTDDERNYQKPMPLHSRAPDEFGTVATGGKIIHLTSRYTNSEYGASIPPSIQESNFNDTIASDVNKPILKSFDHEIHIPAKSDANPYLLEADTLLNRAVVALRIKHMFHWLHPECFHDKAWYGWQGAHSYQPPGHYFDHYSHAPARHKHLDAFRRSHEAYEDDKFLDPIDGRVRSLFVQTISQIYNTSNDTSWRRTYVEDVSPWLLRLAWWSKAGLFTAKRDRAVKRDHFDKRSSTVWRNFKSKFSTLDAEQWTQLGLRWLPSCIGLLILMCFPTDVEGQVRNHGFYDPIPYRFWSYPKEARNYRENKDARPSQSFSHTNDLRISERYLLPSHLCFLNARTDDNPRGRLKPSEWMKRPGNQGVQPTYIFISYTGEGQFGRPCKIGGAQFKATGVNSCNCTSGACERSRNDADALHKIARNATRNAGVPAYWTDQCCMSTDEAKFSEDIYRICDVVRGAQKVVVVVGRSGGLKLSEEVNTMTLLKEWGSRMWTWPEVLLAPIGKQLAIYTRGDSNVQTYSKLDFAREVWDDAPVARYLVDHFENSLALSRLELVVLALECLTERVINGTTPFADGDLSYALMGLLRQRPKTDKTDTAFQAFARLSLANDSDCLLERMICLLPTSQLDSRQAEAPSLAGKTEHTPTQSEDESKSAKKAEIAASQRKKHYWTNMNDHWGVKLWDIEPHCQVAGIAGYDTVILDGAHGATVHWDQFQRVAITTRETWSRMLGRLSVRLTPGWLFTGSLIVATAGGNPSSTAIGAIFLILALVLFLLSPILILHIYSGKVWNSQPWLFGFEGHLSLKEIERKIFGFECDRLSWAPYCSAMSRHRVHPQQYIEDECEGTDPFPAGYRFPMTDSTGKASDGMRLFTIVDTLTMSVSTFYAERPPVVALLCGSEGGMQRAVMCSYDWPTQTMYRETVLRMETRVLERMPRIGRVRFGLKRGEGKVSE